MSIITPDDWHDVAEKLVERALAGPIRVVIIGIRNVGKSSFGRFLTLKLCQRIDSGIFSLETDCGQPDNTPPGVISLSHRFHNKSLDRHQSLIKSSRYLGIVNPAIEPFLYMEEVRQVFNDYRAIPNAGSLIVNCHGYGSGVGLETWETIITLVEPHVVVHIGNEVGELPLREPIQYLTDLPRPSNPAEWIPLSPIIVNHTSGSPSTGGDPNQASGADYRWIKFAEHFRPDLVRKNTYKSANPRDFFVYPYCRLYTIDPRKLQLKFPFFDSPEGPSKPWEAIEGLTVALTAESGPIQFICMAFVLHVSTQSVQLIIPPNIRISAMSTMTAIVRGDVNWSPRDRVSYKNKTTNAESTCAYEEAYFLHNVLGGDDSGANQASSRADLKRRRLSPP